MALWFHSVLNKERTSCRPQITSAIYYGVCVVLPWPGFSQRGLEQGGIESYIYVCMSGGLSTAI